MVGRNYYTGCIDILTNVYDLLEKKYPDSKDKVKKYRKQTLDIFRKANEAAKKS
ncbi:MAG: hypothetical protein OXC46_04255 [Thaumarchaeota archaeon]|nr:hypothetical protein [Nitrososphaerota archaeon]